MREIIERGEVNLKKINTNHNPTDALTKALPGPKLLHCIWIMQIVYIVKGLNQGGDC